MTIDLSQYIDQKVVITLRDRRKKTGCVINIEAYGCIHPYAVCGVCYWENGKQNISMDSVCDIIHIELVGPPMIIDLSQYIDKEVVITRRDGSKSMGTVQRTISSDHLYLIHCAFYTQKGELAMYGCDTSRDIIHIELAEKKVKASLTDASINAISKVIANHLRDEVHDMVANKIRSEFNNEISESLVYKIAIEAIKKL